MKKGLIFFAVGLAVGVLLRGQFVATPQQVIHEGTVEVAQLKQKLESLTSRELEEYRELKGLRARYERADELLGKMILVLIADLGLRVSDKSTQAAKDSARGVHPEAAAEDTRGEAVASPVLQQEPPAVLSEPPPRVTERSTKTPETSSGHAGLPGSGGVPINQIVVGNRRSCSKGADPGWFTIGSSPQDYSIGIDPQMSVGEDQAAFIQAMKHNPRTHAELNHCADLRAIAGKRLKLTALIKAEGAKDYANLHFRAQNLNLERIADERKRLSGTFDWKSFSVEMDVPPETRAVSYGVTLEGVGKIWIRQVQFKILEAVGAGQ